MGKTAGNSWLAIVKKAFRSPTSKPTEEKTTKKKDVPRQPKGDVKRWRFKKPHNGEKCEDGDVFCVNQRRAIALATTAAEAAAITAKAAVDIARLAHSSPPCRMRAAILIQKSFRGFLARSALRAFKGIVKLQALVRGQNVRRQAKTTLRCMQALIRVQDRIRRDRGRLSLTNVAPKTMNTFGSMRETYSMFNNSEWDGVPRKAHVAYALSNKILYSKKQTQKLEDEDEQSEWVRRWMATKQWETERRDGRMKTVEVDGGTPTPARNRRTFSYVAGTPERWKEKMRSPRVTMEENSFMASQKPSMGSRWGPEDERSVNEGAMPGYMAATESARAKSRSVSAARHGPATPEKDSSARKRLYYPDSGSSYSPCSTADSRYLSQSLFR